MIAGNNVQEQCRVRRSAHWMAISSWKTSAGCWVFVVGLYLLHAKQWVNIACDLTVTVARSFH